MSDEWEVRQGSPLRIRVPIVDGDGVVIDAAYPGGGYTGSEAVTGSVWAGGTSPAAFSFTPEKSGLAADGEIVISIEGDQTAQLVPGRHKLAAWIDDDGEPVEAYTATLIVRPMPDGAS